MWALSPLLSALLVSPAGDTAPPLESSPPPGVHWSTGAQTRCPDPDALAVGVADANIDPELSARAEINLTRIDGAEFHVMRLTTHFRGRTSQRELQDVDCETLVDAALLLLAEAGPSAGEPEPLDEPTTPVEPGESTSPVVPPPAVPSSAPATEAAQATPPVIVGDPTAPTDAASSPATGTTPRSGPRSGPRLSLTGGARAGGQSPASIATRLAFAWRFDRLELALSGDYFAPVPVEEAVPGPDRRLATVQLGLAGVGVCGVALDDRPWSVQGCALLRVGASHLASRSPDIRSARGLWIDAGLEAKARYAFARRFGLQARITGVGALRATGYAVQGRALVQPNALAAEATLGVFVFLGRVAEKK